LITGLFRLVCVAMNMGEYCYRGDY